MSEEVNTFVNDEHKALEEHRAMLDTSIKQREAHQESLSGPSKVEYAETIRKEKANLAQVETRIKEIKNKAAKKKGPAAA